MQPVVWHVTPYTILLLAAAAVLTISALYARTRRPSLPGSRTGVLLLLAAAEWTLCSALGQTSASVPVKVFWDKMQFVGIVVLPTAWLVYTLQYTGREEWLTRRILSLLSIVPLTTLLLVFTNEAHGLIWSRVVLETRVPFVVSDKTYGVGFWAFAFYSYIVVLLATSQLIQMLLRSRRLYRWQASALLLSMLLPFLSSVAQLLKVNPFPQLVDPTAMGLAVAAPIVAWSLRRLRLGEIVPVAREVIIEGMSDGVIVLDQHDRIIDLNPVADGLFAHALTEAIGQPLEEVWSDWPKRLEGAHNEAEVGQEVMLSTGDQQRTYDMRISPLVDWRGHLTGRLIVLRDISRRKKAEEEIRRRSEELTVLNVIARNVTSTLDLQEIFRSIQESVMRLLGEKYAPLFALFNEKDQTLEVVLTQLQERSVGEVQTLLGMQLKEFTVPLSALNPSMREALLARKPYVATDASLLLESVVRRELIRTAQLAMKVKCIVVLPLSVKGKLVGTMLLLFQKERVSDEEMELLSAIGSHAAVAIENARLFDELNSLLRERDQAQAQLIQSAKLSAIGQMISGLAHELNNPLTTVMGFAQLLQEADVDEDVKQDLQRIYDDALRAQRIVQNLLTFARQKKPQRSAVDINEVIERTLALRNYQLNVDNVRIVDELAPNLPWTMADSFQIHQVFLNIINNAHEAMVEEKGGGVLTVRSELLQDDIIRVTFADTGPGIPPQTLNKVFDPFFTTKDVGAGTGLGLSVSHGIVQEHGGRIWAESEPGQGATFFVELPVKSWVEDVTVPSPDQKPKPTPSESQRILVIDDERSIVDLIVQALRQSGYQVEGFTSAKPALEKLRQEGFDLLICDIKMPEMDGRACEKEVRAMNPALAERIIFITGDVLSPTTQAFLEECKGRCIKKPFDVEELRTTVLEALG